MRQARLDERAVGAEPQGAAGAGRQVGLAADAESVLLRLAGGYARRALTYLEAAAGILAVEAYHAATLRTQLFTRGQANADLITSAQAISDARDTLDGSTDIDQGITPTTTTITNADSTTTTLAVSHIVPTDGNAVAYSRSTGQVLNIAYITSAAATAGGFFPAGVNGNIKTSIAES